MVFDAAQARRNITIKFVDKDFSKFSVYPVIASYLIDYLHIDSLFKNVLNLKNHNLSFSGTEYLLTLLTIIFLGIKRIHKADGLLADECQLAKILGIRKNRFPNSRGIYRLLSSTNYWSLTRLDKVSFQLILNHKNLLAEKRWLTIDIDQTKKITEGRKIEKAKPCYHPGKKGRLGLRISAATVNGLVFSQKLEPGNVGNSNAFPSLLDGTLAKLDIMFPKRQLRDQVKATCSKRMILRIDGGYFSQKTLRLLEKERAIRNFDFVVRAKNNLKLTQQPRKERNKDFIKPYKDREIEVLVLPKQQVLDSVKHKYKVLIIRDKQKRIRSKKKRIYHTKRKVEYLLITTLESWTTKRIINFYKKRQMIENIFKEQNQSFKANKLPSHKFWGNAFYFQMVSLVANISFFFEAEPAKQKIQERYLRNYPRQIYQFGR